MDIDFSRLRSGSVGKADCFADFSDPSADCEGSDVDALFGEESGRTYSESLQKRATAKKAESAAKKRRREALKKANEEKGYLVAGVLDPNNSLEDLLLQAADIIGKVTDTKDFRAEVGDALRKRAKLWTETSDGAGVFKADADQ